VKYIPKILILVDDKKDSLQLKTIIGKNNCSVFETTKVKAEIDYERIKPDVIILCEKNLSILKNKPSSLIILSDKTFNFLGDKNLFIHLPLNEHEVITAVSSAIRIRAHELMLKKSELEYLIQIKNSFSPIVIIDNDKIIFINESAIKLFNGEKENFLGKDFFSLVSKEDMPSFRKFIEKVMTQRSKEIFHDGTLIGLNGAILYVDILLFPVSFKNKLCLQIEIKDYTALRKKEKIQETIHQLLQASNSTKSLNELYNFIFKIISDVLPIKNLYIALYDKSTGILSFPFYIDEFGTKPADRVLSEGLTEYVIKTKKSLLLNKKKMGNHNFTSELNPLLMEIKAWLGIPLFIKDDIAGVIVIKEYFDENIIGNEEKEFLELVSFTISRAIERALSEEQLNKYVVQLKEINDQKDKFFSIISHDLRSPFNSILGFTEILKNQDSGLSKEESDYFIDLLYSSVRNIYNLVDNMLNYSKFQIGLLDYKPVKINLNEITKDVIDTLKGNSIKKKIEIKNEIENNYFVLADQDMLRSIIQNLISNASKFSFEGGTITIKSQKEGNFVKTFVIDNGVGMNEETIKNLFLLNAKKSTLGTNKEKGTGLGLIIVKEFVEKNGGTIQVSSEEGKGTEFCFTLISG
jgi:signal transduction histidine kinase